jgi:hypothetical protein
VKQQCVQPTGTNRPRACASGDRDQRGGSRFGGQSRDSSSQRPRSNDDRRGGAPSGDRGGYRPAEGRSSKPFDNRFENRSDNRSGGRSESRSDGKSGGYEKRPDTRSGGGSYDKRPDNRSGGSRYEKPSGGFGNRADRRAEGNTDRRPSGRYEGRPEGKSGQGNRGAGAGRTGGYAGDRSKSRDDDRRGSFRPSGDRPDRRSDERSDSRPEKRYDNRSGGGGYEKRPDTRSGGGGYDKRPDTRSSGGGYEKRPDTRSGGGSYDKRPDTRSSGGGYDKRPDTRSGGGGYDKRPDTRSGGGSYDKRPDTRSSGGGYEKRPDTRSGGGGYDKRPDTRSGGGSYDKRPDSRPDNRSGDRPERSDSRGTYERKERAPREREDRKGFPPRAPRAEAQIDDKTLARELLEAPELPEGIEFSDLDQDARTELRTLPKGLAETVGKHLVAAGGLIDTDPEAALAHARYAKAKASRVPIVREALGLVAYHAGIWADALSELRAVRRMTRTDDHIAIIADAERAIGRPERALDLAKEVDASKLAKAIQIELAIVAAGARRDLGQLEAAVVSLQGPDLKPGKKDPWSARLFYAYADNLAAADRKDDAVQWFMHAAEADENDETDAAERASELADE